MVFPENKTTDSFTSVSYHGNNAYKLSIQNTCTCIIKRANSSYYSGAYSGPVYGGAHSGAIIQHLYM